MNDHANFDDTLRTMWRYPGGEIGVRATTAPAPEQLLARVQSSDDLMALVMYLAAVPGRVRQVCIPYLPYARQDRVAVPGDPNAIEALARVFASTGVRMFSTLDAHSPAAIAAFARSNCTLTNLPCWPWLTRYLDQLQPRHGQPLWFVAPDNGARERTAAAATALSRADRPIGVVTCRKVRDPQTGKLRGFAVDPDHCPHSLGADPLVVIVDDICDGGGTFLGVATALREQFGAPPLHLFTTHGIHSRGLNELARVFTTIGATDSFRSGHTHSQLRLLPLQTRTLA